MRCFKAHTRNTSFPLQSPQKDVDLHLRRQKKWPPNPPQNDGPTESSCFDTTMLTQGLRGWGHLAMILGRMWAEAAGAFWGWGHAFVAGSISQEHCPIGLCNVLLYIDLCALVCLGVCYITFHWLCMGTVLSQYDDPVVPVFGAQPLAAQGEWGRTGSLAPA